MQFEVYCDESMPDLFTSAHPRSRYLMIGSLWLPHELRNEVKHRIKELRTRHKTWGEIKWTKISRSRLPFYIGLVDLFESYGLDMRFRCIAVDSEQADMKWHEGDGELGFYKFYYQLLHHWVLDFNEYRIFCDTKSNRDLTRLRVLQRCLGNANLSSKITSIQALPSGQVALMQLCDLLLGMASSRINDRLQANSAKEAIVHRLEGHLGIDLLCPTPRDEQKFNVFNIRLQGGW